MAQPPVGGRTLFNRIEAPREVPLTAAAGKPVSPEQMKNSRLRAELAHWLAW